MARVFRTEQLGHSCTAIREGCDVACRTAARRTGEGAAHAASNSACYIVRIAVADDASCVAVRVEVGANAGANTNDTAVQQLACSNELLPRPTELFPPPSATMLLLLPPQCPRAQQDPRFTLHLQRGFDRREPHHASRRPAPAGNSWRCCASPTPPAAPPARICLVPITDCATALVTGAMTCTTTPSTAVAAAAAAAAVTVAAGAATVLVTRRKQRGGDSTVQQLLGFLLDSFLLCRRSRLHFRCRAPSAAAQARHLLRQNATPHRHLCVGVVVLMPPEQHSSVPHRQNPAPC